MSTNLDRRNLLRVGAATAGAGALAVTAGAGASASAASASKKHHPNQPPQMVLGTQRRASDVATLQEFKRHGVQNVCGYPPAPPLAEGRGYWTTAEVAQTKEFIESQGLTMDMVALSFLGSTLIDREARPAIMLGKSPERDRDIDDIHKSIQACAEAGVSTIKYNMSILGVLSTGDEVLRGGSATRRFRAADLDYTLPDTIAGKVSADDFWERIDYFLERVVPVAEQYKVQLACHPQDPGTPRGGYRGVAENVLSVPGGKGLFRFLSMHPSAYHGLNLCVGTLSEMLWDPQREVYDIVRRLARTQRIFNIHLRNIIGNRDDFVEVWPDEGDIDHARIINILAEEGYTRAVDPDHVPDHPDDAGGKQAYAQGYGFILGAIKGAAHRKPGRQ